MNITKIAAILEKTIEKGYATLICGSPGGGKTAIIEQVTKKLGYDLITDVLSIAEPTDFKGLPGIVDGKAQFLPYDNLEKLLTVTRPTVYFVDDLGWAPLSCQNCFASLLYKREVNGQKISDHVRFVSATNSKKDNANVNNLSNALLSRFHTRIDFDVDAEAWVSWGSNNDIDPSLLAFIKNKPSMISTFTGAREEAFACPRTLNFLSDLIKIDIIDLECWSGCTGKAFALEFYAFYQLVKKVGDLPSQIMLNPKTARIDLSPDLLYFIIIALGNRSTDSKKFDIAMEYINRIPVEFQVFAVKLITAKNPKFMESSSYILWSVKNQSAVQ